MAFLYFYKGIYLRNYQFLIRCSIMSKAFNDRTTQNWYLVQIKRNSHKLAERNLNRQKFKTFLPFQYATIKNGYKFSTRVRPLFPGYIFVRIKLDKAPWHKIKSTVGVSRLICQGGVPKTIPTEVVSGLMSRCDQFGKLLPLKSLKTGDSVAVLSGALANFVATVETIDSDNRIWVLMDILGQLTRVQLAAENLEILN